MTAQAVGLAPCGAVHLAVGSNPARTIAIMEIFHADLLFTRKADPRQRRLGTGSAAPWTSTPDPRKLFMDASTSMKTLEEYNRRPPDNP
jgi:hypothetical protein